MSDDVVVEDAPDDEPEADDEPEVPDDVVPVEIVDVSPVKGRSSYRRLVWIDPMWPERWQTVQEASQDILEFGRCSSGLP